MPRVRERAAGAVRRLARSRLPLLAAVALAAALAPSTLFGQQDTASADGGAAAVCARAGVPRIAGEEIGPAGEPTPEDARAEARRLSAAATQAELLGDTDAAVDLLRRALRADPGSADDRYRLARLLQERGDTAAAIGDYCHYLATAPAGQDRSDAEARLLAIAPPPPRSQPSRPAAAAAAPRQEPQPAPTNVAPRRPAVPSLAPPQSVLVRGLLLPGAGQLTTGRAALGLAVGVGVAGAVAAGVLTKKVSVDCLSEPMDGVCPAADVLRRHVDRPLLVPGIAVAAAGTVLAAIEAFRYRARQIEAVAGGRSESERTSARLLPPSASPGVDGVELRMIRVRF